MHYLFSSGYFIYNVHLMNREILQSTYARLIQSDVYTKS